MKGKERLKIAKLTGLDEIGKSKINGLKLSIFIFCSKQKILHICFQEMASDKYVNKSTSFKLAKRTKKEKLV